jgi:hypothetical protein
VTCAGCQWCATGVGLSRLASFSDSGFEVLCAPAGRALSTAAAARLVNSVRREIGLTEPRLLRGRAQ